MAPPSDVDDPSAAHHAVHHDMPANPAHEPLVSHVPHLDDPLSLDMLYQEFNLPISLTAVPPAPPPAPSPPVVHNTLLTTSDHLCPPSDHHHHPAPSNINNNNNNNNSIHSPLSVVTVTPPTVAVRPTPPTARLPRRRRSRKPSLPSSPVLTAAQHSRLSAALFPDTARYERLVGPADPVEVHSLFTRVVARADAERDERKIHERERLRRRLNDERTNHVSQSTISSVAAAAAAAASSPSAPAPASSAGTASASQHASRMEATLSRFSKECLIEELKKQIEVVVYQACLQRKVLRAYEPHPTSPSSPPSAAAPLSPPPSKRPRTR